jgi:hypothetical protein
MYIDVDNADSATGRPLEIEFLPIRTSLLRAIHFSLWCRWCGRALRLHELCSLNCVIIMEFWHRWSTAWLWIPKSCIVL